jgi:hypothetical protein
MDHAHQLGAASARRRAIFELALAAAEAGEQELARSWLVDLVLPAARARVAVALLRPELDRPLGSPRAEGAVEGLREVVDLLLSSEAWQPLDPLWLRRDDALSLVALDAGRLGLGREVARLQAALSEDTPAPLARLAVARLWVGCRSGAPPTTPRWQAAARLVGELSDVRHRRELAQELARVAAAAGEPERVRALLPVPSGAEAELVLGLGLAEALWGCGAEDEAAGLWSWTVDAALQQPGLTGVRAELGVAVARCQERWIGSTVGELTWRRLVQAARGVGLSSDARSRGPWAVLARAAQGHGRWSTSLRHALREQPVLPPVWAAVLGTLEVHAGHPSRARSIAEALAASQEAWGEDVEPGVLAALLFALVGDAEAAEREGAAVLGRVGQRAVVLVGLGAGGPGQRVERLLVESLVEHISEDAALKVIYTVPPGPLRAELVACVAQRSPPGSSGPLVEEAVAVVGRHRELERLSPEALAGVLGLLVRAGRGVEVQRCTAALRERAPTMPAPIRSAVCTAALRALMLGDSPRELGLARELVSVVVASVRDSAAVVGALLDLWGALEGAGVGVAESGDGMGQDET